MANRRGSARSKRDRSALAAGVGLSSDGLDRTPEQRLWFAVLVQGLYDCMDGIHWSRDDFEHVCENAGCDPLYVLRKFREKTGL